MQEGIQLRIGDLLYVIKKRWKLIVLLTVIGLIIGIGLSGVSYLKGTMSRSYDIKASAVFLTQAETGNFTSRIATPERADFMMSEEMIETVKYILKSERLMTQVIDNLELIGISPSDISSNLRISTKTDTPILEMTLSWRTSEEGLAIMTELLNLSTATLREVLKTGSLVTIDAPSARYIVGGSINIPTWGLMAVVGMAIGVAAAIMELLVKPTLINIRDISHEYGLEVIGTIKKNTRYFKDHKTMMGEQDERSQAVQAYSAASYILRNRLSTEKGTKIFYVTSAKRGEGKTTACANIAYQLAEMECKVLLIDFDTRNPNLGKMFLKEVDYAHSLNALYKGDINEREAITRINGFLDILPVVLERHPVPIDTIVIDLVKRLSEKYDYVIMDAPSVGEVSDALSLNQIAKNVLMVIGYDMSLKTDIKDAIDVLDKSGVRIIGCIVNQEQSVENSEPPAKIEKTKTKHPKKVKREDRRQASDMEEIAVLTGRNNKKQWAKDTVKKGVESGTNVPAAEMSKANEQLNEKHSPYDRMKKPETAENELSDEEITGKLLEYGFSRNSDEEKMGEDHV